MGVSLKELALRRDDNSGRLRHECGHRRGYDSCHESCLGLGLPPPVSRKSRKSQGEFGFEEGPQELRAEILQMRLDIEEMQGRNDELEIDNERLQEEAFAKRSSLASQRPSTDQLQAVAENEWPDSLGPAEIQVALEHTPLIVSGMELTPRSRCPVELPGPLAEEMTSVPEHESLPIAELAELPEPPVAEAEAPLSDGERDWSETLGVSLSYIMTHFVKYAVEDTGKDDPAMGEWLWCPASRFYGRKAIGRHLQCPRDGGVGSSFVDALPQHHKGPATDYLSWSYRYTVRTFVAALGAWYEKYKRAKCPEPCKVFIWICLCCNNQWRLLGDEPPANPDYLKDAFETRLLRMSNIKGVMIVLLDTWDQSVYTKRIWCIFEVFRALVLGVDIELVIPPAAVDSLKGAAFERVMNAVGTVNVESAEASVQADVDAILRNIRDSIGPAPINGAVRKLLKNWVLEEYVQLMKEA